jgi:hypothetical protein
LPFAGIHAAGRAGSITSTTCRSGGRGIGGFAVGGTSLSDNAVRDGIVFVMRALRCFPGPASARRQSKGRAKPACREPARLTNPSRMPMVAAPNKTILRSQFPPLGAYVEPRSPTEQKLVAIWFPRRCRVLDLSRTGVRLKIANAHRIPDVFTLILSNNSSGFPARVKWRRQTQIGAEFSSAAVRRPGSSS